MGTSAGAEEQDSNHIVPLSGGWNDRRNLGLRRIGGGFRVLKHPRLDHFSLR